MASIGVLIIYSLSFFSSAMLFFLLGSSSLAGTYLQAMKENQIMSANMSPAKRKNSFD